MDLQRLRDSPKEGGVKELWAGKVSPEVKDAWKKAKEALQTKGEDRLKAFFLA